MNNFDLLNDTSLMPPIRVHEPGSWVGHIPFGAWLVAQAAPRLLVELGTHTGNSYFSFCQAVAANGLATQCYAVDTWAGDDQAGHYGEDVFQSVQRHNERLYGGFSALLRMTFDEAVTQFDAGAIDLLHIDGLHTYEAVRHDFETWQPKLSDSAVVLFHDTSVREKDFGVWRLWEELSAKYPHIDFPHSHGLGVLFVGADQPAVIRELLEAWATSAGQIRIRRLFERLGHGVFLELTNAGLLANVDNLSQLLARRDEQISGLYEMVGTRDQRGEELSQRNIELQHEINLRDQRIDSLDHELAGLNQQLVNLNQQNDTLHQQRDTLSQQNDSLNQQNAALNQQNDALNQQVAALNQQIDALNQLAASRDSQIAIHIAEREALLNSKSWRVTKPLRIFRQLLEDGPRRVWRQTPISFNNKQRIKRTLFGGFPFLFRWSRAYRNWDGDNVGTFVPEQPVVENEDSCFREDPPASTADPYVPLFEGAPPNEVPVRLIAMYLPQFHAIPENDAWWGEGFTEWTNVRPASPQFEGHYQPHVPGELGYYNLLDPAVQRRQVELARLYGVGGFCFYSYWFAGKRLLEKPVENYLHNRDLDLPFCICWANENWSRRWDGLDQELLIAQQHSPEDDLAFIEDVARYMRDERYIRVNGRPLLIVYWPGQLPSAKATANRWRQWCRDNGLGEIYLAYTQSLETGHPGKYGFDAAIEFPPNYMAPPEISRSVKPLSPDFAGRVFDWRYFVERARHYTKPEYTLFRGCCPSWDNTARRKNKGTVFLHSSPTAYREWLVNAIKDTCERFGNADERLVFVNAWNEWAEGAHLEPDQKYGYAWLDATRKALVGEAAADRPRLVVVSHDAHPHGAQFLALGMVRSLVEELKLEVEVVLLGPGRLHGDFAALAPVHDLSRCKEGGKEAARLAADLARRGFTRGILNTTVAGWLAPVFREAGIDTLSLVHELPGVIRDFGLQRHAKQIAEAATAVVFPSPLVAEGFAQFTDISPARRIIRPQGLYRHNRWRFDRQGAKAELCRRLGLAPSGKVVLTVGYADRRKGIDLFVEAALAILARRSDVDFVWVGHWEEGMQAEIEARLKSVTCRDRLHFVGYDPDTAVYHAASDVYALTSREDPFPNVVLESFDVAVPVVAFAGTGGAAELVEKTGGLVAPALDAGAFAEAVHRLLDDPSQAEDLGISGQMHVDRHLSFRTYLFDLCRHLGLELPRVSVIVPNFNYAGYIEQRLESIRRQTLPFYELIILDDASTDDSLHRIEQWLARTGTEARLVVNPVNSGNAFAQWRQGVALATGDYVWIAEADDLSDPDFLATVFPPLQAKETVLSYCESRQIDAQGHIVAANYHDYLAPVAPRSWQAAYTVDGRDEIRSVLAVLNTIPNVSAVLFRRAALAEVFARHFEEITGFRKAGDWVVYLRTLAHGRIAFSPRPANRHRRHDGSVIGGSSAVTLCQEIAEVQGLVAKEYDLDFDVRRKAADYLSQLHSQFGLSSSLLNEERSRSAGEKGR